MFGLSTVMNVLIRSLYRPFWNRCRMPRRSPGAFLAHVGDEQDVGAGLDPRRVHRAHPGQQHGEAAGVVADARREESGALAAHLHVGAGGKHGVEMRRDADQRAVADAARGR